MDLFKTFRGIPQNTTIPSQPLPSFEEAVGSQPIPDTRNVTNVAVLVIGKDRKGILRCLLTQRAWRIGKESFKRFDFPGGGCEGKSILQTAQEELYEETAAFADFEPSKTKEWLSNSSVHYFEFRGRYANKTQRTLIFVARLEDLGLVAIDDLAGLIDNNYEERLQPVRHREKCRWTEKDGWRTVPVSLFFEGAAEECRLQVCPYYAVNLMDYAKAAVLETLQDGAQLEPASAWLER